MFFIFLIILYNIINRRRLGKVMQMKRKYHEVLQERDAVRVKELRRQLVATRTDQGQQQSQDGQQQEKVTGEDDEQGSENE